VCTNKNRKALARIVGQVQGSVKDSHCLSLSKRWAESRDLDLVWDSPYSEV
jgi:hypothetical protein